jgi:hypothetical protein
LKSFPKLILLALLPIGIIAFVMVVTDKMTTPEDPARYAAARKVILFNDGEASVRVATDSNAMLAMMTYIKDGTDQAKAQMNAAEIDGRLFSVPNGTRAEVLKESDPVGRVTSMVVKLTTGSHAGEKVMCFSTVTQPDR